MQQKITVKSLDGLCRTLAAFDDSESDKALMHIVKNYNLAPKNRPIRVAGLVYESKNQFQNALDLYHTAGMIEDAKDAGMRYAARMLKTRNEILEEAPLTPYAISIPEVPDRSSLRTIKSLEQLFGTLADVDTTPSNDTLQYLASRCIFSPGDRAVKRGLRVYLKNRVLTAALELCKAANIDYQPLTNALLISELNTLKKRKNLTTEPASA